MKRKHDRRWRRRVERLGFLITGKRTPKELPGISGDDLVKDKSYSSVYDPKVPETKLVEDFMRRGGTSLHPEGPAATLENLLYALRLFR